MNKCKLLSIVFAVFLFSNVFLSCNVKACKDIVACGDATAGDYNLLLKVRDPSRPGPQVLCIVPEGYEYTYRHPWTGKTMSFKTEHKYIGVASEEDIIPNIVKAGMALSDSGISYGDADTNSNWKNPTKYAWDDFDWIRYACEKADDEDEAVMLLTEDAVNKLHATGVSENLFVVGPNKGFVVEADAFRYDIKEINDDVVVMSNYPKELWKTQYLRTLPIARSFDTVVEKYVRNRGVVRLQSFYGVKIVEIGEDFISVKLVPFIYAVATKKLGVVTKIQIGERKNVADFSVELLEIDNNKAKVRLCYKFKVWEDKMMEHIQPRYGSITLSDMMSWSRLHSEDLDGLRPMCEDWATYEAVAIYKIPSEDYEIMSSGWFAPNHACSSIYVPFHICDTDIFNPYETGEAAQLSLDLLDSYGHGTLTPSFSKVEEVFLCETGDMEEIATELIADNLDVSEFLTITDIGMQKQAWLTEQLWMEASKVSNQKNKQKIIDTIDGLWEKNYTYSLRKIETVLHTLDNILGSAVIMDKIEDITLDICKSKVDASKAIGRQSPTAEEEYETGKRLVKKGEYESGFDLIEKAFIESDTLMKGGSLIELDREKIEEDEGKFFFYYILFSVLIVFLIAVVFVILLKKKRK